MNNPAPKKHLGQHFLINTGVIERIAEGVWKASRQGQDPVLEIGPGPGPLTEALLKKGLTLHALEIDPRMIEHLQQRFAAEIAEGRFVIHRGDATTLDFRPIFATHAEKKWVACGNLPYNVGTVILFRVLELFPQADRFSYMLQKEVVERLTTTEDDGNYGPAAVKIAWSTRVRDIFKVGKGSFNPPPKVESAVVTFDRLPPGEALAYACERGGLYDKVSGWVNRLFQGRRKMLRALDPAFQNTEWATMRPSEIRAPQWIELYQLLKEGKPS